MKVFAVWFSKKHPWDLEKSYEITSLTQVIEFRDCNKFMTATELAQWKAKSKVMKKFLNLR